MLCEFLLLLPLIASPSVTVAFGSSFCIVRGVPESPDPPDVQNGAIVIVICLYFCISLVILSKLEKSIKLTFLL